MIVKDITDPASPVVDMDLAFDKLEHYYDNGLPKGKSTGWKGFNKYFQFTPEGQLTIVTGAPTAGKSEWVDSIAINMILNEDWKVLSYTPETHPLEFYLRKLCEKMSGSHFCGSYSNHERMSKESLHMCKEVLKKNFVTIDTSKRVSDIKSILATIRDNNRGKKIDMVIIDPWNKLEHSMIARGESRTELIGKCLTEIQFFARDNGVHFFVVAHPAKPMKKKDGTYPEFTLYDVADSANFYNMIDNGFILMRDQDMKRGGNTVKCTIAKVKNHFYGDEGEHYFDFNRRNGRFSEINFNQPEVKKEVTWAT